MSYNFCTLFDRNYASRGLALYRSLERQCARPFRLTILCMDIQTRNAFERMALPNTRLMLVEDLGDAELLAVRQTRAMREFCWTCPSALMRALLTELPEGGVLTYIDADLAFFSDPQPVFDEMGDKAILIHGHRYAPRYVSYAATSGIFNVGLIAIRNGEEGRACLERWRAQCLDKCELDPENGYCGDQKYLDEWPSLYSGLVVAQHPGICVAPWNVENYRIGKKGGQVTADDAPVIFYHYHALKVVLGPRWGRWAVQPSVGYVFRPEVLSLLYGPYVRLLREAQAQLSRLSDMPQPTISWRQFYRSLRRLRQEPLVFG